MNLLETYIRATIVHDFLADAFKRQGLKTEARLLRIQSDEVLALLNKAMKELPAIEPFEAAKAVLSGKMSTSYREKRRLRGKYYERIGKADKRMLTTLRNAFDSLYKEREDWNRREQLKATSQMMKALMESSKKKSKQLIASNKP